MSTAILLVTASALFLVWALIRLATPVAATRSAPPTVLDEAERILTARYAAGAITPDQYREALAMLRT